MKDRYVLITGATSGIGYEFTKLFAKKGYNLIISARDKERLEEIKKDFEKEYKIEIRTIAKDLSKENSAEELFGEIQKNSMKIRILINNAGIGLSGRFDELDLVKQVEMINLNLVSLTKLTYLVLKEMLKEKHGKILNVASTAGFLPGPYMNVYYATKAYVLYFSQALSDELKESGVTVTALCPGPTRTNFAKNANVQNSFLFKNAMDASKVAEEGYKALIKGKKILIPGIVNKFFIFIIRFIPRSVLARTMERTHKST